MIDGVMMNEVRKTRSLLTIPVNITSVKVPMMPTKIMGMMIYTEEIFWGGLTWRITVTGCMIM
jgi:hypothetical protein